MCRREERELGGSAEVQISVLMCEHCPASGARMVSGRRLPEALVTAAAECGQCALDSDPQPNIDSRHSRNYQLETIQQVQLLRKSYSVF